MDSVAPGLTPKRCVLDTNQVVGADSRWLEAGIPERPEPRLRLRRPAIMSCAETLTVL